MDAVAEPGVKHNMEPEHRINMKTTLTSSLNTDLQAQSKTTPKEKPSENPRDNVPHFFIFSFS